METVLTSLKAPDRLRILEQLLDGAKTPKQLRAALGMDEGQKGALSHNLSALREAGLVRGGSNDEYTLVAPEEVRLFLEAGAELELTVASAELEAAKQRHTRAESQAQTLRQGRLAKPGDRPSLVAVEST